MANKYTYSVPFTEEQLFDDYVNGGMSQKEIALKYGTTQKVVWRAMGKMGIVARKARKREQGGEKNSSWRGGRILVNEHVPDGKRFYAGRDTKKGYWMVRMPSHPHAGQNGYVFEHIVVALKDAGRNRLDPDECVHHIDFDRQNNNSENLCICKKDVHRWYHANLETLTAELLKRGVVGFHEKRGYYFIPPPNSG